MTDESDSPVSPGEDDLDVRAIGRDPVELERFYRAFVVDVERFVARRVRDVHSVADVTSEVFIRAMTRCHRFDPALGSPRAWLYGIAYRVAADHERQGARRARAHVADAARSVLDRDAIGALEDRMDAQAQLRSLRETFDALPPRDRALLELIAIDGLSVTEAAAALKLTPGAARVRLHRARRRLDETVVARLEPPHADDMAPVVAADPATA